MVNLTKKAAAAAAGWVHVGSVVFEGTGVHAWSELDLSSYVGSNYALVMLRVKAVDDYGSGWFRPYGDLCDYEVSSTDLVGANVFGSEYADYCGLVMVETDSAGKVEWYALAVQVKITLLGYIAEA